MGGKDRAVSESEKVGQSSFMKKFLKFLLERCGNCEFRVQCWSKLFPDKARLYEVYREIFFCDGVYRGENQKESFDGKQTVDLIRYCAKCQYLDACVTYIITDKNFIGLSEATSYNGFDHSDVVRKCAVCPHRVKCWSGKLKDMNFGWQSSSFKITKMMLACPFVKRGSK